MKQILLCVLMISGVSEVYALEFSTFLDRVQKRDPRTKAILRVLAADETQAMHGFQQFHVFEISLNGDTATVEVFNNYKTGRIGETYSFEANDAVRREYARYRNYQELQTLDKAVAEAERERRIFVLSGFRLKDGATLAEVQRHFGKTFQVVGGNEAGCRELVFGRFHVEVDYDNKLQDIRTVKDAQLK